MKASRLYVRLTQDEVDAMRTKAEQEGITVSEFVRRRVLGDVVSVSQKVKTSHAPKPSRTVEKEIPSVPKETKDFLSLEGVRCVGGVHCPMTPVVKKDGKWFCELHSIKKG